MARPKNNPYSDLGIDKETFQVFHRRIEAAVKFHGQKFEPQAKANLSNYANGGDQDEAHTTEDDHLVVVNRVLPNIELKANSITFRKPEFIMTPSAKGVEDGMKVGKAAMAYYWRTEDYQDEIRKVVFDAKIVRFGVLYTGWRFETEDTILDNDRQITEGDQPSPEEMARRVSAGDDPTAAVPLAKVIQDAPCIKRIKPLDFMFEPGADYDLDSSRYVVHREVTPLDEFKANPNFDQSVLDDYKGSEQLYSDELLTDDLKEVPEEERPDDCKTVTLLHYWEKRRRLHCVFVKGCWDKPALAEKWPFPFKGYPFDILVGHAIPDLPATEARSDVDLVMPLQNVVNHTRSRQVSHIEQFNEKYQCRTGTLTPSAKRQLRSSRRGIVVEHNGAGDQGLWPLTPPSIQPEVYQVEQRSLQDIDYVLGVNDYLRNTMPTSGRRTATEVSTMQQSGSTRFDVDVTQLTNLLTRASRKVLALLKKFAYHTRSLPIYNEWAQVESFVDVNVETIAGEYDIEVEIGSTQALNEEAEKQNAIFLLQTLTPYLQLTQPDPMTGQPVPILNIVPLIKKLVQLSGIKNADEIVSPPPQPMAPPMAPPPPGDPMAGGDPAAGGDPMQALAAQFGAA